VKIKAACIQLAAYDVTQSDKAMKNALDKIEDVVKEKPQLIVLPGCIYPGCFTGMNDVTETILNTSDALSTFRNKAKEHGVYIAVGLAEQIEGNYYNSGYLLGPEGQIIGVTRKSFLRHFGSKLFTPESELEVHDTPIGRIGIILCADGRQPEISRVLTLKGAQLIIDLTNLATTGSSAEQLSNPQYEYILPTRAVENKVWFVIANKVGTDADSILYCGKSCIISPTGFELAVASSDHEQIIFGEMDLTQSENKRVDSEFDCIKDRVPEAYSILTSENENPAFPIDNGFSDYTGTYASVVQLDISNSLDEYLSKVEKYTQWLHNQGSQLLVFPEMPCTYQKGCFLYIVDKVQALANDNDITIITSAVLEQRQQSYKVSIVCIPQELPAIYKKVHLSEGEKAVFTPGGKRLPVFSTPFGNIGIMMGYEGLLPEVPRALMLSGADLIVWQMDFGSDYHQLFSRTRAAENRIFIMASNTCGNDRCGLSLIVNPYGDVIASAFTSGERVISAQLEMSLAHYKQVVPGTNVLKDRKPYMYQTLTEVK
jgi:predicted amidohydrolase